MGLEASNGWAARLALGFERRGLRTVLAAKQQYGPLTVQRPFYPEADACHLYLLHPPGGIVGGDELHLDVRVRDRAHALITTPGAAKLYRSAGPRALLHQRLTVDGGGVLEWLPQETILFPGAGVDSRIRVELGDGARFLGWDIQSLGRPVIGERFATGSADLRLDCLRGGRPVLMERLRVAGESDLDGPCGLRGLPINGLFLASGAGAEDLAAARAGLQAPNGVLCALTLIEDLLLARCLAVSVELVHRIFVALWGVLRPRLLGRGTCPPRIWAT